MKYLHKPEHGRNGCLLAIAALGIAALVGIPASAQAVPATGSTNCSTHTYYLFENGIPGDVFDGTSGPGADYLSGHPLGDRFCTKGSTIAGYDLLVDAAPGGAGGTCMFDNNGTPYQEVCGTHPKAEAWGFYGFPNSKYEIKNYNSYSQGDSNCMFGPTVGQLLGMTTCLSNGNAAQLWAIVPD